MLEGVIDEDHVPRALKVGSRGRVSEASMVSRGDDLVHQIELHSGTSSTEGREFGGLHAEDSDLTTEVVGESVDVAMIFQGLEHDMGNATNGGRGVRNGPTVGKGFLLRSENRMDNLNGLGFVRTIAAKSLPDDVVRMVGRTYLREKIGAHQDVGVLGGPRDEIDSRKPWSRGNAMCNTGLTITHNGSMAETGTGAK